jgi:hypothetical protein
MSKTSGTASSPPHPAHLDVPVPNRWTEGRGLEDLIFSADIINSSLRRTWKELTHFLFYNRAILAYIYFS